MAAGYSLQFPDELTDYVVFDGAIVDTTGPFTVSLWLYALPTIGQSGIPGIPLLLTDQFNPTLAFQIYQGNFYPYGGGPLCFTVNLSTWYNVIMTYDGTSAVNIYQGGTVTSDTKSLGAAGATWFLGNSSPVSGSFNGCLCGFRTWNRVLNSGEIAATAAANPTIATGPTHHYTFLEAAGAVLHDVAGNLNGTLTSGVTWSTNNPSTPPDPVVIEPAITLSAPTVHPGGSLACTILWASLTAPGGSNVVITPTCDIPGSSFSPSTVTGDASNNNWNAVVTLSIPIGASTGGGTITLSYTLDSIPSTVTQGVTVAASLVQAEVSISPLGDLFRVLVTKVSDGTPVAITAISPGAISISVNGGSPIPIVGDWLFDATNNFAIANTGKPAIERASAINVLPASGATTSGTWGTTTGFHDYDNQFKWLEDIAHYSSGPAASITYTAPVLTPGSYGVYAILDHLTMSGGLSTRTTDARYTVKDGATTVATVDIDQTAIGLWNTDLVSYAWLDKEYHYSLIGTVTITTGSSVTVEVTNQAGSGQLFANAILFRQLVAPVAVAGDTVTVTMDDGKFITPLDTTAPLDAQPITVDVPGPGSLWMPYTTGSHTMKVGYNINFVNVGSPNFMFADRMRGSGPWGIAAHGTLGGSPTFHADGSLDFMPAGSVVRVELAGFSGTSPVDQWGYPTSANPETYRIPFNSTGSVTADLFDPQGIGLVITNAPLTASGSIRFEPTVAMPALTPNVAYSPYVALQLTAVTDSTISGLAVYDHHVGTGWTSPVHPVAAARFANMGAVRWMTPQGINGAATAEFVDLGTNFSAAGFTRNIPATLASVEPVDLTGADADDALKYVTTHWSSGWAVVKANVIPVAGLSAAAATATVTGDAVTAVTVTDGGSGYFLADGVTPFSPTVLIQRGTGDTTGRDARAFAVVDPATGTITSIRVTNGGTGYTATPTVVIASFGLKNMQPINVNFGMGNYTANNPGGINIADAPYCYVTGQTTFLLTCTGGSISSSGPTTLAGPIDLVTGVTFTTITNAGTGYTSAPTVSFSGGGGSGATAIVTDFSGGTVKAISVTDSGTGYTSAPTVSFSGGGGSGATATANVGGDNTVSASVGNSVPLAYAIEFSNEIGADLWWNVYTPATDDCVYQMALQIADNLDSGLKWKLEFGNEFFNNVQTEFRGIQWQTNYWESQGWDLSGGDWYQGASLRGWECYEQAKQAFSDAGRDTTDIEFVLGSQQADPDRTDDVLGFFNLNSVPCPASFVAIADYYGNTTNAAYAGAATATATLSGDGLASIAVNLGGSGYDTVPVVTISGGGGTGAAATATLTDGSVTGFAGLTAGSGYTSAPTVTIDSPSAAFFDRLDSGGQMEVTITVLRNGGHKQAIQSHIAKIAAFNAANGTDIQLNQYECGLQTPASNSDRTRTIALCMGVDKHPIGYHAGLSEKQFWQDLGIVLSMRFTYDIGLPSTGQDWKDYESNEQALGTGTAGENPNPWNIPNTVSQVGAAQIAWAAATVPPVPEPPGGAYFYNMVGGF